MVNDNLVNRVTANLAVENVDVARQFFEDFLGLEHEDMGLDWVTRLVVPRSGEHVQVVSGDATAEEDSAMTVKVTDVDAAYEVARSRGYEIVHPLVTERWGVRRFFVRVPGGPVLNIAQESQASS